MTKGGGLSRELSVGEVSERSGVPVSALHFYENKGLINSWRTAGNQRRYGRDVLRRLGIIKVAQRVGIPLAEIKAALDTLPDGRTPNKKDWSRLSARWREDLNTRIEQLTRLRNRLDGCIGCGCLSMGGCPLYNPGDSAAERGSGPQYLEGDP